MLGRGAAGPAEDGKTNPGVSAGFGGKAMSPQPPSRGLGLQNHRLFDLPTGSQMSVGTDLGEPVLGRRFRGGRSALILLCLVLGEGMGGNDLYGAEKVENRIFIHILLRPVMLSCMLRRG